MSNLTLNYINKINNNPVDRGYHWVESWLFSTNAKQIGILYGIFAIFSGLVGLSLSILMRIELASPNPQILMHNGQLWNGVPFNWMYTIDEVANIEQYKCLMSNHHCLKYIPYHKEANSREKIAWYKRNFPN